MVDRLSVADAMTLHSQTTTAPAHCVAVLVLEASDQLSHPRLQDLLATALPQEARFRSRLVGKPMGVGQPVWSEFAHYDPTRHIRAATVSAPGGSRELADLVTNLSAGTQNWRRSLWEAWTINGLAAGRWALAVKMSPVLLDEGHGLPAVWQRLTTGEAHEDDTTPTQYDPAPAPSLAELATDTVVEMIENHITGAWLAAEAVTRGLGAMRRRLSNADDSPSGVANVLWKTPAAATTVFNAPLTEQRSTAFASIRLADAEAINDAFGGSIANVVLTACTLALRSWLLRYEEVPEGSLLIAVPLSTRAGDAAQAPQPLSVGHIRAPVHLDDPVQMLSDLHTATERVSFPYRRNDEARERSVALPTMRSLLPPWLSYAGRQVSGLGLTGRRAPTHHGVVAFASRPGHASCAGSEVVAMYALEPLVEGCGLNIGVLTHHDVIDISVTCCPDRVPDVEYMSSGIADAMDALLAAAAKSPRGEGRSVVSEIASHSRNRS